MEMELEKAIDFSRSEMLKEAQNLIGNYRCVEFYEDDDFDQRSALNVFLVGIQSDSKLEDWTIMLCNNIQIEYVGDADEDDIQKPAILAQRRILCVDEGEFGWHATEIDDCGFSVATQTN